MRIEELHNKLFDVLCIIDDICKKENIRYFLDSGTEIGAVREKDFIAWDDDMDIKVLLEDYETFRDAMNKHLPSYMHIAEPDIFEPYFFDFTIRIYDDRFLLREENEEDKAYKNYQNRVGTDVFIISKAPNNFFSQKKLILDTKILYGKAMAHRFKIKEEKYSLMEKMQTRILRFLGRNLSCTLCYKRWKILISKWAKENTGYRFAGNYTLKNLRMFKAEWYENTEYGEIRGRKFPVPGGFHEELTYLYGDYMTPPKDINKFQFHLDVNDRL